MVLTYRYPPVVAGGHVAPTLPQMVGHDRVVVDIDTVASTSEDDTPITHNLSCKTADGSDGSPELFVFDLAAGTVPTKLGFAYTSNQIVTASKIIKGANTSATWRLTIKRPYSVGQ
jgi:hypothetical protein